MKSWIELVSEANRFRQSHVTDDAVFQTPDNANILLPSSPLVVSLSDEAMRLPGEPSHGNYYEI